jgi:hypothetical protein
MEKHSREINEFGKGTGTIELTSLRTLRATMVVTGMTALAAHASAAALARNSIPDLEPAHRSADLIDFAYPFVSWDEWIVTKP